MLNNDQIVRCLREVAFVLKHEYSTDDLHHVEANQRAYAENGLPEFKRDLAEAGNKLRILFMEYHLDQEMWPANYSHSKITHISFYKKKIKSIRF